LKSGRYQRVFIGWIIAAVVVAGLAYPFKSTVVPTWKIQVVDQQGRPYTNLRVRQAWKHYSLELEVGENIDDRWTDRDGYVEFPERTIKLSLLSRTFRMILTSVRTLFHGSTGISADIAATGPLGYKSVEYIPSKPPEKLVLPTQE
jgi:hypothetical protein